MRDHMNIFFNEAGRIRSGWRLLTFAALFFALFFFSGAVLWGVYGLLLSFAPRLVPNAFIANAINWVMFAAISLAVGYFCARKLEGLPWRSLGASLHKRWLSDLLIGALVGMATLVLVVSIVTIAGGLSFGLTSGNLALAVSKTLFASAIIFIVAAFAEEALFRGYPLQTLTRAGLAWLGVLLTSLPFAVAHLDNPNVVQPFASINTALAGVWLAAAYLKTRSLWFATGTHWAWNWVMGSFFGLPVSGITIFAPNPVMRGEDLGPAWLTGGAYGPEGGLACTVALLLSTFFVWRTKLVRSTEDLKKLTSEENPAVREQISILTSQPSL